VRCGTHGKEDSVKQDADLLMFDLDGTLIDSTADLAAAVNHTLGELGLRPLRRDEVASYIGDGLRMLLRRALDVDDPQLLLRAVEVFLPYYEAHLLDTTTLFPGVRETLERCAGYRKAVITNKQQRFTDAILEGLGVRGMFDVVLGGDALERAKPDPLPLREAMRRTGVTSQRAVMIGDGPNDVLAARAAGVRSVAVTYGLCSQEHLLALGPDIIIESFGDLCRYFPTVPGGRHVHTQREIRHP